MKISISEAKANLSEIVNRAYHGEKVVILKNNVPLVDIVPHEKQKQRQLGMFPHGIEVHGDIMEEDQTISDMFHG